TFVLGAGSDTIDGGTGFDVLDLSGIRGPVTVDFGRGQVAGAGLGSSQFTNIDLALFGAQDDVIRAGSGNDVIATGDGNNTASSGAGDDMLIGGAWQDMLTGGSGNDSTAGG